MEDPWDQSGREQASSPRSFPPRRGEETPYKLELARVQRRKEGSGDSDSLEGHCVEGIDDLESVRSGLLSSRRSEGVDWTFESVSTGYVVFNAVGHWLLLSLSGGPACLLRGDWSGKAWAAILLAFHVTCMGGFLAYAISFQKKRAAMHLREASTMHGGYQWLANRKHLVLFMLGGLVAGVCAGALGIGGGIVKAPLMLQLDLMPMSAVTTATFMILFTSASTSLSFALAGRLDFYQAIVFSTVAFVGAVAGTHSADFLNKKYQLQSLAAFILGGTIALSMLCMLFCLIATTPWKDLFSIDMPSTV